jgi:hypothetical protein
MLNPSLVRRANPRACQPSDPLDAIDPIPRLFPGLIKEKP